MRTPLENTTFSAGRPSIGVRVTIAPGVPSAGSLLKSTAAWLARLIVSVETSALSAAASFSAVPFSAVRVLTSARVASPWNRRLDEAKTAAGLNIPFCFASVRIA